MASSHTAPLPPADVTIRPADPADVAAVSSILTEAADWLRNTGRPLWQLDELAPTRIDQDVRADMFFLACIGGEPAGCVRFQLEDPLFWPDVPADESAFVHRLAVRRRFAGGGVSRTMLDWAKQRAKQLGRRFLRLDTAADRPALCAIYERNGFRRHSIRQVGPYLVVRFECEV